MILYVDHYWLSCFQTSRLKFDILHCFGNACLETGGNKIYCPAAAMERDVIGKVPVGGVIYGY